MSGNKTSPVLAQDHIAAVIIDASTLHHLSTGWPMQYDAIAKLLAKEYPDAAQPDVRPLPWSKRKDAPQVLASLGKVDEFMEIRSSGNGAKLLSLYKQLNALPIASTPYARLASLDVYTETRSKNKQSTQGLLIAELRKPDTLYKAYDRILEILDHESSPQEQMVALTLTRNALGDEPNFAPRELAIQVRLGSKGDPQGAYTRCVTRGIPGIRSQCDRALGLK